VICLGNLVGGPFQGDDSTIGQPDLAADPQSSAPGGEGAAVAEHVAERVVLLDHHHDVLDVRAQVNKLLGGRRGRLGDRLGQRQGRMGVIAQARGQHQ